MSDGESSGDLVCDHLSLIVLPIPSPIHDRDPATPRHRRQSVEGVCPSRVGKLRAIARAGVGASVVGDIRPPVRLGELGKCC